MAESEILSVIRVWAAVAWADGGLVDPEAEGLRRLIKSADLTTAERAAAAQVLEREVALPDAYLANLDPAARRGIYRAACRMAIVDRAFTSKERSVLNKLRVVLGVPDDIADDIESTMPGIG